MSSDKAAIAQLLSVSKPEAEHVVLHYLYFPKKGAALVAAAELRRQQFAVEDRLGADGQNWLVLARHAIIPSEATIGAAREIMEKLAKIGGGEYDGWEAET